jgi:hypothetical protein
MKINGVKVAGSVIVSANVAHENSFDENDGKY